MRAAEGVGRVGGVCVDVFGGDALRVKRNPSSFFLFSFQILFHLRRRAASFLTWAQLIRSLGARIDVFAADQQVCYITLGRAAKIGPPRRRILTPAPTSPSAPLPSPPPSSALAENDACSTGFEFLLITEAAIITPNCRRAAGAAEATAALRACGGKKKKRGAGGRRRRRTVTARLGLSRAQHRSIKGGSIPRVLENRGRCAVYRSVRQDSFITYAAAGQRSP